MTSIRDLLQKGKQRSSEDMQLELALELSKQEHIKEQKKLLQEYTQKKKTIIPKKRRIIQKDEEEEDWFQTISSRPQDKNQAKTKKEVVKQEESFEFDLTSIFNEEVDKFPKDNADNSLPMVSDAESDCSVIDLCNGDANQTNKESVEKSVEKNVEKNVEESVGDDDDGYLSPLEGFESLNDSAKNQQYFAQFATKPTRKRKATPTTNTNTRRKKPFKRWYKKKTNK